MAHEAPEGATVDARALADALEKGFDAAIADHMSSNDQFFAAVSGLLQSGQPVPPGLWLEFIRMQERMIASIERFAPVAKLLSEAGDPDLGAMFEATVERLGAQVEDARSRLQGMTSAMPGMGAMFGAPQPSAPPRNPFEQFMDGFRQAFGGPQIMQPPPMMPPTMPPMASPPMMPSGMTPPAMPAGSPSPASNSQMAATMAKMRADQAKTAAEIRKIHADTNDYILGLQRETYEKRKIANDAHNARMRRILTS